MMSFKSVESLWIVVFRVTKPCNLVDGYHCLTPSSTLKMEIPASSETVVTVPD